MCFVETTGQAKKNAEGEVEEKDDWDEPGEDLQSALPGPVSLV